MNTIIDNGKVILFIDEIHQTIGAGNGSQSNIDVAALLMPYIDEGKIKLVAATTDEEYDKYMKETPAYKRRFQIIHVKESNEELTKQILLGSIPTFEKKFNVKLAKDIQNLVIDYIVKSTNNSYRTYTEKLCNPDLALTILKTAFSIAAIDGHKNVKIDDIAKSISIQERLYETARNRISQELLSNSGLTKDKGNVLTFKSKNRL